MNSLNSLIELLRVFFSFIFEQLGNVANFFISNNLGIIMISFVILYVVFDVVVSFLNKSK